MAMVADVSKLGIVEQVLYACFGGEFCIVLDDKSAKPGSRWGKVINDAGEVIGQAYDYIYGGRGWTVHILDGYSGFVADQNVVLA
jgi:hypothetical protein